MNPVLWYKRNKPLEEALLQEVVTEVGGYCVNGLIYLLLVALISIMEWIIRVHTDDWLTNAD